MKNKFNIWSSHGTDEIWMKKKKKTKPDIIYNDISIFPALKHNHVTDNTSNY